MRCPKLRDVKQGDKMSLINKLEACTRCLMWGHTVSECNLEPSKNFLQHDDCEKGQEGIHHPYICPKRSGNKKTTVSMATNVGMQEAEGGSVFNLLEEVDVKARHENSPVTVNCVYDNCSDSNWISSSLAESLPRHKVSNVNLQLSTVKSSGPIKTKQHTLLIRVRNRFKTIMAYETSSIGASSLNDDTVKVVREHFKAYDPLHISSGKIDLLIGLKDYDLHPQPAKAASAQSLRLFTSSTTPKKTFLVAGTLPAGLMGGAGAQKSCFFSIADLYKSLLQDQALDLPPAQCQICRTRSKKCYKCTLISKPMSLKDQYEFDLITKPMVFDKESRTVTTRYLPTTKESFKELFPPELNNRKEATAIAKRTLRSLKKNGQVEAYHAAFQKNVADGTFTEISDEKLREWDDQGLPSNYVSLHPVKKIQSDPSKTAFRIVTNSSLNRLARVGDKIVSTSLNAVLPQASYKMNTLVNITLGWLEKEVSVLLDQQKAYNTILPEDSIEGRQMLHLRRIVYWEDPNVEESKLVPKIYAISKVHFGDSCSAAILENLRQKVAEDMSENNLPESSEKLGQVKLCR